MFHLCLLRPVYIATRCDYNWARSCGYKILDDATRWRLNIGLSRVGSCRVVIKESFGDSRRPAVDRRGHAI